MSAFNYTARRNLITGHTAGLAYDVESEMQVLAPASKENAKTHVSLDGSSETLLHRVEDTWQLTTVPLSDLADSDFEKFKEFLTSVMGGEQFTFDAYGTVASPDNVQNSKYIAGSYKPQRVSNISQSSAGVFAVSFRLRIL